MSLAHWLEERQKVYEARQRRVEAICHKNNVSTMSSNDTMEDLINFSVHNDSATGECKTSKYLLYHLDIEASILQTMISKDMAITLQC